MRSLAGQNGKQDCAQSVDVGSFVDIVIFSGRLFRCHIQRRADDFASNRLSQHAVAGVFRELELDAEFGAVENSG